MFMKSKLIILGCGSSVGVPRIDGFWGKCKKNQKKNIRSRCSALVVNGNNLILIDVSPDVKKQLLSNNIRNISSVILTHEHADQTNGLFELRPFYWKHKKKINVYGSVDTLNHIKKAHYYLFKGSGDYPPIIKSNIVKSKFTIGKLKEKISFQSIKVRHGRISSLAYVFKKTAYISDCNDLSIVNKKEFKKLKYLILDCLKYSKHPSHFNLNDALYVHYNLQPKKTILTNLHYDLDYDSLYKLLPKNMIPAHDGLELNL